MLLSNLVENAWRAGRDLDLGTLIAEIQSPPLRKLGVFELDQFFPPADRTKLAFTFNALVASPTFAAWGEGEPLDPQRLLFTEAGKPRCAVVYLAHLSEEERQFVVTLVFSKLVTWMRGQEGTPDLRALAYMDEVFGYVPPSASPPAKKPILTIFKQGRAFGLGLVLSTQNPVDLDYKAMSNAGTWLVGRLQTENDKARVLEGLRSATGGTDVAALDRAIGALGKRQFLLVSAKASEPRLFATRWAMSYLRGPLTKEQVAVLTQQAPRAPGSAAAPAEAAPRDRRTAPPAELAADESSVASGRRAGDARLAPRPRRALGVCDRRRRGARRASAPSSRRASRCATTTAPPGSTSSRSSRPCTARSTAVSTWRARPRSTTTIVTSRPQRPPSAAYVLPTAPLGESRFFTPTAKEIQRHLVDRRPLELQRNRALKLVSRPGETAEEFAARCDAAAQERADAEAAKIRDRLEAKRDRLEKALAQAERRVEELETDTRSRTATELIAGAGAVLGALFGGRRSTRSIASAIGGAASRRGITARIAERKRSAEEKADATKDDLAELEQEILDEVAEIDERWRATADEIDTLCDPARGDGRARARDAHRVGAERLTIRAAVAVLLALAARGVPRRHVRARRSVAGDAATVEWVNDGDTLTLAGGAKVRLVQIDAPELQSDCYGRAALRALIDLTPKGTRVTLVADPELDERDEHGRLLRYVFLDGLNVNVELVDAGRRRRTTSATSAAASPRSWTTPSTTRVTARRATGARVPAPTSTRASARSPALPETAQRQGTSGDA